VVLKLLHRWQKCREHTLSSRPVHAEGTEQASQPGKSRTTNADCSCLDLGHSHKKAGENTKCEAQLLEEQKNYLTKGLSRIDELSTHIDSAICHAEKTFGPVADLTLDDKIDNHPRQRFDRPDEGLTNLKNQCIFESTKSTGAKRVVPAEQHW
jgi:hypothetical protein